MTERWLSERSDKERCRVEQTPPKADVTMKKRLKKESDKKSKARGRHR